MAKRMHRGRQRTPSGERGIVMVLALFTLTLLTMVAATSALIGATDVRATRNYRGASQAHFVAESAIAEAVQRINDAGVVNFQNDIANQWSVVWGANSHSFTGATGYTYAATTTPTVGNTANAARITATAAGPEGSRNIVVANVVRSNIPETTPGAVYLASDAPTDARFYADAFLIDGNDANPTGGAGPNPPVPGMSTRNSSNTQEALNSLSAAQRDNVRGEGYSSGPPITPSVVTSAYAPSVTQMNQMITDLLSRPYTPVILGNILGVNTWGTAAAPKITYATGIAGLVTISGTVNGVGILIVDGDLTLLGNLNFQGLVIVRGQFLIDALPILPGIIPNNGGIITALGTAVVYGSMWTEKVVFNASGTSQFHYSSVALGYANSAGGGGALPAPVRVTSLIDCAQVPAGVGGC